MIRLLYWLSYIPTAPFYAVSWVAFWIAQSFNWVGDWIHSHSTYKLWLVLHQRKCDQLQGERKQGRYVDGIWTDTDSTFS